MLMKKSKLRIPAVLAAALLTGTVFLSGCDLLDQLPELPKLIPVSETETAAEPEAQAAVTEQTGLAAVSSEAKYGMMIHIDRTTREVYDPAEGSQCILTYAWDSVRVESEQAPDAALRMTEELAALQDIWYTGSGDSPENKYGYDAMLGAAEDNYSLSREYGVVTECAATRYVTVLRSDSNVCAFQVSTVTDLGNGQKSGASETLYFDTRTGARLTAVSDEPPRQTAVTGEVKLIPLDEVPDGSIEIADQVVIGDGGETLLLAVDGEVKDFSIQSVTFTDRFYTEGELFFCGSLRNCAIQISLLMPGDLPNTMIQYTDAAGEHQYLIGMSGEDGSFILMKNQFAVQG